MDTQWLKVDRGDAAAEGAARQAACALAEGKLVAFPTETVYGVAALATCESAMENLRELKDRPSRPFSVHMAGPAEVQRYVSAVPEPARRMIRGGWPGPLTLILPVGAGLGDADLAARDGLAEQLCSDGYIGLRCPDEPVAQAMLAGVDGPVVAPSANLAGQPSPRSGQDVIDSLNGRIDMLLDTGPTQYGNDSTIVRVDGEDWSVLRAGVLSERDVRAMLKRVLLFVCTGNTCRSPMAAGLARKILAEKEHCRVGELPSRGVEVLSAGVSAGPGQPATPAAIEAAGKLGADISSHRSRPLTGELIRRADRVFCMTAHHARAVADLDPTSAGKIVLLGGPAGVADPIGSGLDVYVQTARDLESALKKTLTETVA